MENLQANIQDLKAETSIIEGENIPSRITIMEQ